MSHQIVQSKLDLLSLGDADQRPMLGGERFNIDRSAASRALCHRMGSPMISRFDPLGCGSDPLSKLWLRLADRAPRSGRLIDVDLGQRMPSHIRARQGRSSDIALGHHSLVTVPERFDPVLRAAALERQEAHDLERISRRSMKRALFQDDILANREFS